MITKVAASAELIMKTSAKLLFLLSFCGAILAHAQISNFTHVIVIVQENRTPDNLFQGLCTAPFGKSSDCNTKPTGSEYDIQTTNWVDKTSSTGTTNPGTVTLDNDYDPSHTHLAFTDMCDEKSGACLNDGGANNSCTGTCPTKPPYHYVTNTASILNPYLTLATSYGWANYMFQTNQGPSFPAHQFIFGGTSAPSAADDAIGTFASENVAPDVGSTVAGCIAAATTTVELIDTKGENQRIYPCFEHETMADLFDAISVSWKYYTPSTTSIWTAPNAIDSICVPSEPTGGVCTGPDWVNDVIIKPSQALTDIKDCKLVDVSWVIPSGSNSDHAGSNKGGGPSWVASIVNAVGNNAKCKDGEVYWDNTAIIITWDDWGGWFDHEPPTFLAGAQGDYQYGFRIPLLVVSAYTSAAYVDNNRMDFGSILRFLEQNFSIEEGALDFADARATTDLTEFFNLKQVPRVFTTIPTLLDADYFINDKSALTDPDDY
jgi:phospholipase C